MKLFGICLVSLACMTSNVEAHCRVLPRVRTGVCRVVRGVHNVVHRVVRPCTRCR